MDDQARVRDDGRDPSFPRGPRDVVLALSDAAFGDLPLDQGELLVHRDVRMHMDGVRFRGRSSWRGFISYLRHRERELGLHAECDAIVPDGDRLVYRGRLCWGAPRREHAVEASFRVVDGEVVELWTSRRNYAPILGEGIDTFWGFAAFLVRLLAWCHLRRS